MRRRCSWAAPPCPTPTRTPRRGRRSGTSSPIADCTALWSLWGRNGSVVLDSGAGAEGRITRIEPTRVDAKDTTGAGDAFTGAVAARLAAGDSLPAAAAFASVASGLGSDQEGHANGVPGSGGRWRDCWLNGHPHQLGPPRERALQILSVAPTPG